MLGFQNERQKEHNPEALANNLKGEKQYKDSFPTDSFPHHLLTTPG